MNNGGNIGILDLYFKKKKNIIKTADHLILKMPMTKVDKSISPYLSKKEKYKALIKEQKQESHLLKINKEQLNQLKIEKYKKILLPSLFVTSSNNKSTFNSRSINKKTKDFHNDKSILFITKKINFHSLSPTNKKYNLKTYNKKLRIVYNEDFKKKKIFERFKENKKKNIMSFSFEKYNRDLLNLSYFDISKDSYKVFQKNKICMEEILNGRKEQKAKFKSILKRLKKNSKSENETKSLFFEFNKTFK